MTQSSIRAVAILRAKAGKEQALVDFTLESLALIRSVEGLHKVEVSRSLSDPRQLVLCYWWDSGALPRGAPVRSHCAQALVDEDSLVLAEIVGA
jgi:hypothetical protein